MEELKCFKSDRYLKVATGVGLTLSAIESTRAIIEYAPDLVISVGSAGAMNSELKVGSVVSFSRVLNRDQDLTAYRLPLYSTLRKDGSTLKEIRLSGSDDYTLISSSTFFTSAIKEADAGDMEAYSVALSASSFSIPVAAFKLITDVVGQRVKIADYKRLLREGRERLEEEVSNFINLF